MAAVAATAERLFPARQAHAWPPAVIQYDRWETIHTEAATGMDVIDNVTDAISWANNFIARAGAETKSSFHSEACRMHKGRTIGMVVAAPMGLPEVHQW